MGESLEYDTVYLAPTSGGDCVKEGLYFYPKFPDRNGKQTSDVFPICRFCRKVSYDVLPLGDYRFGSIEKMREVFRQACRFAVPGKEIVNLPTENGSVPEKKVSRIEVLALKETAVCSISPLSRDEARDVVFSIAAQLND